VKNLEQVAPKAVEVAELPVPVALMKKRNNPPRAVEADFLHAVCVREFRSINHLMVISF
jgi:hypothetical protein